MAAKAIKLKLFWGVWLVLCSDYGGFVRDNPTASALHSCHCRNGIQTMSNRLLINPGTPQAWQIELNPGLNRIGRGESNDHVINHPSVSTHHCEITVTDSTVTVRDLGSTNGTFVERVPVNVFQLHNGQHVQFGSVDMMFDTDMAPVLPSPAVNMPGAGARIVLANPGAAAPPPPPPPVGGLKINRPTHAAPPPAAPVNQTATPGQKIAGFKPAVQETSDDSESSFGKSLGGVFLGAFLGMIIWHLLYRFTGWSVGFMALVTGCMAGAAPQLIGHHRSKLMGFLAALITLAAIFITQYFNARLEIKQYVEETASDAYSEQLTYAKRAVQAIPNETEDEIRIFLAAEESDETYKSKPEEIDAEEVKMLKDEMPKLRDLVSGKTTKEKFNQNLSNSEDEGFLKFWLIFRSLSVFNIVNIFLGTGAAFLTANGDSRRR